MRPLDNSFALVTGASSGIGRAIAIELASRGINLLLVALPTSGLKEVQDELMSNSNIRCEIFEVDLIEPDAALRLHTWCRASGYRVRYLVNNAGFGNQMPLEESNADLLVAMMNLNNQAMVRITQLFIPHLKRNPTSYVMNVGSLAAFLPIPNKSVYAATKSFVWAFSSALRVELRPYRIRVSCLCPGPTSTSAGVNSRLKGVDGSRMFTQQPCQVASAAVNGMLAGRRRILPGWQNKFLFALWQLLPAPAVDWILTRLFARRAGSNHGPIRLDFPGNPGLLALAFR